MPQKSSRTKSYSRMYIDPVYTMSLLDAQRRKFKIRYRIGRKARKNTQKI